MVKYYCDMCNDKSEPFGDNNRIIICTMQQAIEASKKNKFLDGHKVIELCDGCKEKFMKVMNESLDRIKYMY